MDIITVNCFGNGAVGSGNPAAVIIHFTGSRNEKQAIANKLNFPVTVFITDPTEKIPLLEYFYPTAQMLLCLHGSLAAAKILHQIYEKENLRCITASGEILSFFCSEHSVQVEVSVKDVPFIAVNKKEIYTLLNLSEHHLIDHNLPFGVVSVGSPKLLIPIISTKAVTTLKPCFEKILNWSLFHGVNGLYVYARNENNKTADFIARGFNPKTGHNEDAATGVAAGALALALKQSIVVEQGQELNRPCRMNVIYLNKSKALVGGITNVAK